MKELGLSFHDVMLLLGFVLAIIAYSTGWALKIVRDIAEVKAKLHQLNGSVAHHEDRITDIEHGIDACQRNRPWEASFKELKEGLMRDMNSAVENVRRHFQTGG